MARPTKQGIDYFPLDVHLDDKFKFVEIMYGLEGFGVVVKLMQNIYANGYWYKWESDEELIFSYENKIEKELLQKIVLECLNRDIFNKSMFDKYKILTSRGIQKRYQTAVYRRKDIEIVKEYLLIDDSFGVNVGNNKPDDTKKVAKSKPDDSKEKQKIEKDKKQNYAEFVKMTEKEYDTLIEKHNKKIVKRMIEVLNNYKGSTGKTYKSDYMAMYSWVEKRVLEEEGNTKRVGVKVSNNLGERRDDI